MPGNGFKNKGVTIENSPCIGICRLDEDKICVGCKRNIHEIIAFGKKALTFKQNQCYNSNNGKSRKAS